MLEYLTGLDITDGSSVRMDCPECKGRRTFTVSNLNGQLLWNCYKAGCSISGANRVTVRGTVSFAPVGLDNSGSFSYRYTDVPFEYKGKIKCDTNTGKLYLHDGSGAEIKTLK